jgi:hypothetical protein
MDDRFQYVNDDEIIVGEGFVIEPCPQGTHHAVCVDVVSLGLESSDFGDGPKEQAKVMLVWQVETETGDRRKDGSRFIAERKFTASLHPKGKLRPFLEQWRGRDFIPEELTGFNLAKLKGANCSIGVEHKENQNTGFVNANVLCAEPYKDASGAVVTDPEKFLKSENYVRRDYTKKPKGNAAGAGNGSNGTSSQAQTSNDKSDWVPF